jgi:hypothetical protein
MPYHYDYNDGYPVMRDENGDIVGKVPEPPPPPQPPAGNPGYLGNSQNHSSGKRLLGCLLMLPALIVIVWYFVQGGLLLPLIVQVFTPERVLGALIVVLLLVGVALWWDD